MAELNRTIIIHSIIDFLNTELNRENLDEDGKEGLAIGIQCLETAYGFDGESSIKSTYNLEEVFEKYLKIQDLHHNIYVDKNEKITAAEILKNKGNSQMDSHSFEEAISCYSKAIELDPKNSIFYCNRAAALNSIGNHDKAIEDCKTALKYDPLYHKAYGRMGFAFKAKNQLKEAKESFEKASWLQPENEGYKMQLKDLEKALENTSDYLINLDINGTRFSFGNNEDSFADVLNMANRIFNNRNQF